MTLAEIRTATRNFIKEWATDAGTQFPADNVRLDFYINSAVELVILELVSYPEIAPIFLDSEDIDLVAGTADYTLTAEWLAIWKMERNVSDDAPRLIPHVPMGSKQFKMYVGETAEFPEAYTRVGQTIKFLPTPSTAKTAYAKCWIVIPEAATMVSGGPAVLPRAAHRLIPLKAAEMILGVNDADTSALSRMYAEFLTAAIRVMSAMIQQQPRFIGGSAFDKAGVSTRDNAFYDDSGFFDR